MKQKNLKLLVEADYNDGDYSIHSIESIKVIEIVEEL